MVYYLTVEDIIQIQKDVMDDSGGGGYGIRNESGIKSAVIAPQTSYFGVERYKSLAEKAAVTGFELITQHPFIDGNKRLGHAAMSVFLHMNAYIIDAEDDEQESIVLRVAAGTMNLEDFTNWVETKIRPFTL